MFRVEVALLTVGLMCLGLGSSCAEYSESDIGVLGLLEVEAILVNQFDLYLEKAEKERDKIVRYLDYVDNLQQDMGDPEEYFGNPLNAFMIMSRFAINWKHEILDVLLANDSFKAYNLNITHQLDEQDLEKPAKSDLLSATSELLDAQMGDNLSTSVLANEIIFADEEGGENITLSAGDCYEYGRNLYKLQHYDLATEWLLQARAFAYRDEAQFPYVSQLHILEQLTPALQKLGSYKLANKLNKEILKTQPNHEAALQNKIVLEKQLVVERIRS